MHLTPSAGRLLLIGAGSEPWPLRAIFWGGERLTQERVREWSQRSPQARQFNLYGTSETPQAALIGKVEIKEVDDAITLGGPVPWVGASLAGVDGTAVAFGEVGEIVIDLADPVTGVSAAGGVFQSEPGKRHFTGDFGYALSDRQICFLGRRDDQVQLNGYRVELGEVSSAAEALDFVSEAKAVMTAPPGERVLLFVVARDQVTAPDVRTELSAGLPDYMMPAEVHIVETMPMTPNGKIDVDALIATAERQANQTKPLEAVPQGDAEIALAEIFKRQSGAKSVSRTQALADLGADSLSIIETRFDLEADGYDLPREWEWMPLSQLAKYRDTDEFSALLTSVGASRMSRLDSVILVRFFAILYVLAQHSELLLYGGGSITLMALAGLSLGRLQLPVIVRDGHTGKFWSSISRLMVPLMPVAIATYAIQFYIGNHPHPAILLLYENIAEFAASMRGTLDSYTYLGWVWFLHDYIQIFALLGILLAIPPIYRWFCKNPWRGILSLFVLSEMLFIGSFAFFQDAIGDDFLRTQYFGRLPTSVFPFFVLGLAFAVADITTRRWLVLGAGALHWAICALWVGVHTEWLWLAAVALCLAVPYVSMPRFLASKVTLVAAQSLIIYLAHRPIDFAMRLLFQGNPPSLPTIIAQVVLGVLLGIAVAPIIRMLGIQRLASRQVFFARHRLRHT